AEQLELRRVARREAPATAVELEGDRAALRALEAVGATAHQHLLAVGPDVPEARVELAVVAAGSGDRRRDGRQAEQRVAAPIGDRVALDHRGPRRGLLARLLAGVAVGDRVEVRARQRV